MVTVQLLGGACLRTGDTPLIGPPAQRHRIALLALVVASWPQPLSRDRALALLWPERDTASARRLLNLAVHVLRSALGDGAIASMGDGLLLNPSLVRCDLYDLRAAIAASEHERVTQLYTGPLLDGFHLDDSTEFAYWLDQRRLELDHAYTGALRALAQAQERAGDVHGRVGTCRRLVAADPHSAVHAQALMRALDAAGDRAGAIQHAAEHANRLRADLGLGPDAEVLALAERLRTATAKRKPVPNVVATGVPLVSVAVLPFLNLSPDPENEYFADGMAEEIINALTKVEGLRVTARSSAFSFKGKGEAGREIGRRLKVGAVLEGSVRRAGSRIRVSAELINVADGFHLWSEKYDREMVDVFAIQDEISRSIVEILKVKLLGPRDEPLVQRPTDDLEAYTTYLKGRYHWNRRTPEALRKSIALFREAQARDPKYALPYAGEADAYNVLGWWADLPPVDAFSAARSAAARAVALDPDLAEGYASQAFARLYYDWDWANAEADFRRSIALNPKYPIARQWYSQHLISSGRSDEARGQIRLAAELDPLSLIIKTTVSLIAYYDGRFEESAANAQSIIENDPNFGISHRILGRALLQLDRYDEGIAALQKAVELSAFSVMLAAEVAHGHARAGHRAAALAILADLRRSAAERYVSAYDLAGIHIGLDDHASALDALEQACAERSSHLIFLRVDPVFRGLRSEPRFQAVLARVGAPDPLASTTPAS